MTHAPNTKHKWKNVQQEIAQLGRMIQRLSQVVMFHEEELAKLREPVSGENQADEVGQTDKAEPQKAKIEDYFGKSENTEDTL